jgi:hypothetical protein
VRRGRLLRQLAVAARLGHFTATGHPVVRSFEPGEDWFWDYRAEAYVDGPALAPPQAHPSSQPAPGPQGKVPAGWQRQLHR